MNFFFGVSDLTMELGKAQAWPQTDLEIFSSSFEIRGFFRNLLTNISCVKHTPLAFCDTSVFPAGSIWGKLNNRRLLIEFRELTGNSADARGGRAVVPEPRASRVF